MPIRVKSSSPRSEMRTMTDGSCNYIIIRFWDDKNNNWEYHVYAEVVAKEAARDVAAHYNIQLPSSDTHNVRQLWDLLWKEKI
jgi:hypothetical protein